MGKSSILKKVCTWCGKDLGTVDGQGVEGISGGICPKCAAIEYKKLDLYTPKPWNLVGRAVEYVHRKKLIRELERREDNNGEPPLFASDSRFHAVAMLTGQPLIDYIDLVELSDLRDDVADEPEMRCRWN